MQTTTNLRQITITLDPATQELIDAYAIVQTKVTGDDGTVLATVESQAKVLDGLQVIGALGSVLTQALASNQSLKEQLAQADVAPA